MRGSIAIANFYASFYAGAKARGTKGEAGEDLGSRSPSRLPVPSADQFR